MSLTLDSAKSAYQIGGNFTRFECSFIFTRFECGSIFTRFDCGYIFTRFECSFIFTRFECSFIFTRFECSLGEICQTVADIENTSSVNVPDVALNLVQV